jgi:hypothetical protein
MIAPAVVAAGLAASLAGSAAAKSGKAPPGLPRFLANLLGAPVDYFESIVHHATGGMSNRFNPSGPFSFLSDLAKNSRYIFGNIVPSVSAMQESQEGIGPRTEFSLFSDNGLPETKEALRHTLDALGLWIGESAKLAKNISKMSGKNQFSKTTEDVMEAMDSWATTFRKFFIERASNAVLGSV